MKRKWLLYIIIILLCSNLITIYFLWNSRPVVESQKDTNNFVLYELEGKGDNWQVNDYKVLKTTTKIKRSLARLVYLGESNQLDQSTYFTFQVIEENKVVYSNEYTSEGGSISILLNIDDLGSIESELTKFDMNISRENIENTEIKLIWEDNNGKINEETIKLSIIDEVSDVYLKPNK